MRILLAASIVCLFAGVMATSAQRVITGTALYRERIALPQDAVFEATLEDVSRADANAEVIGRVRLEQPGQPPFAFTIEYDPSRIDQRFRYSVRARITQGDRLLFTTDQSYPVLTSGAGSTVSMVLRMAPPGRVGSILGPVPEQAAALQDTTWRLTHLGTEAVKTSSPDREITLRLDSANNRVTGSAGCNRLTGEYAAKGNALSFTPLVTTRMSCPDDALEARYLAALDKVSTYRVVDRRLELLDAAGELLARFEVASTPPAPFFGDWRVIAFKTPGVSAMTSTQAAAWTGKTASYGPALAVFGDARCAHPSYDTKSLSAEDFVSEYRVSATTLGITASSVTLVTVSCEPAWGGAGSVVIVKAGDRLLTPWDGVFFELERRKGPLGNR